MLAGLAVGSSPPFLLHCCVVLNIQDSDDVSAPLDVPRVSSAVLLTSHKEMLAHVIKKECHKNQRKWGWTDRCCHRHILANSSSSTQPGLGIWLHPSHRAQWCWTVMRQCHLTLSSCQGSKKSLSAPDHKAVLHLCVSLCKMGHRIRDSDTKAYLRQALSFSQIRVFGVLFGIWIQPHLCAHSPSTQKSFSMMDSLQSEARCSSTRKICFVLGTHKWWVTQRMASRLEEILQLL